ncbi:MAG TPA: hypothetical protein VGS27_29280 [Candidatus Sulfotelmatobacter sp.]|nr:hypothetical protein [Candidatus Sulfotelmatobacter sp.]
MNPHELRFRRSGRALYVLIGLWIGLMAVAWILAKLAPHSKSDVAYVVFAVLFSMLFVAIFIVGVLRMLAYVRWTGKYPYYFLFKRSGSSSGRSGTSNGS